MSKQILLLVDFSNILYKALAITPFLSHKGMNTGGLFGFIQQLCYYINEHEPIDIVFCLDTPPYIRKDHLPEYKRNRSTNSNEDWYKIFIENKQYCIDFLRLIKAHVAELKGYEADDWIATLCIEYAHKYEETVVVSNDDDLFQVLAYSNVKLHRSGSRGGVYSREQFIQEFTNIHPSSWAMISALSGGHNGLPGIKGIGVKRAIKIVNDEQLFQAYLNDDLKLWIKLATLPLDEKLQGKIKLNEGMGNWTDPQSIEEWLRSFGIRLTSSMEKAFIRMS